STLCNFGCQKGTAMRSRDQSARFFNRREALATTFGGLAWASLDHVQAATMQERAERTEGQSSAPIHPKDPIKITRLETMLVKPRWLFLKIPPNAGIVGWGEPIVEGRALTVAEAVKEIEPYLVGKD